MKRVIAALVVLIVGSYAYVTYARLTKEVAMEKKVILVVASNGFQEHEYQATCNALEHAGYEVTVISDKSGVAVGHNGAHVEVNGDIASVHPSRYAALYIIGGPGTIDCLDTPVMHKLLNELFALQKPYGAICLAPRILAHAQVLRNKKATGWDGDGNVQDIFAKYNVVYVNEPVVVDGNVITAHGPEAADAFGAAIVTLLNNALSQR